jgi:hypothetical protein
MWINTLRRCVRGSKKKGILRLSEELFHFFLLFINSYSLYIVKNLFIYLCLPFFHPTVELALIMDRLYGGVCYAGIDIDPELKYPKGAGRVAFSNQQSYIAAISARFVQLQHGDIDKRVRMRKSFFFFLVLDDFLTLLLTG